MRVVNIELICNELARYIVVVLTSYGQSDHEYGAATEDICSCVCGILLFVSHLSLSPTYMSPM
ncbi:hypothetical protein ABBQ38_012512 [Trebouxia sp. C0009 RCD-2024]